MPDVDENMDELFRKASDNYMLQDGESRWDEISARLEPAAKSLPAFKKNNTQRYILMAVLSLLFFIAGDLFHDYTSNREKAYNKRQETKINEKPGSDDKKMLSGKDSRESVIEEDSIYAGGFITSSKPKKDIQFVQNEIKQLLSNTNNVLNHYPDNNTKDLRQNSDSLIRDIRENIDPLVNNHSDNSSYNSNAKTAPDDAEIAEAAIGEDASLKNNTVAISHPASTIKIKKHSGVYFGLLAGAAFNFVKQQDISKPGLDIGLIAGYQVNRSLSLETGILYSRKNYYTDGKYFNMEKVANSMPAGMQVVSLNGSSRIIEFPVKVQYNFIRKSNTAIYGAAGVSSYLLTNEKNDYTTFLNSTTGNIKSVYKENAGYFAGAINLSAGYGHQLGARGYVRFEPYMEIPIKGIGVGKLPVASSGVHVLITIAPH